MEAIFPDPRRQHLHPREGVALAWNAPQTARKMPRTAPAPMSATPNAPRLLPLGDTAFTVEFGTTIAPDLHARVRGFAAGLAAAADAGALPGVIEWLPAFASVTVFFDPDNADPDALAAHLLSLARQTHAVPLNGATWTLPVCFDEDFGPDLDDLAARCGLDRAGVIARLTGAEFSVWMLGFLPGFPYLGGLPAELAQPRLATPRTAVPAGSLAVADALCAVYPWTSPGGWRLLGRCPVPCFDVRRSARPALLAPGDRVRWQAVTRADFDALAADFTAGRADPDRLRAAP